MKTDFPHVHFDCIETVTPNTETQPKTETGTVTKMDTDKDMKTYVLAKLEVQLPNSKYWDQITAKLDMSAEANILPVRIYRRMFPQILPDGSPNPEYLQSTHLGLECNKDSVIRSPECITLDIALAGKKLITSQFFLSNQHDQSLIGHPACDKLGAYTCNVENFATVFDHSKLLPQFFEVNNVATYPEAIKDVQDQKKAYP